jgi:hypothetical protein
VTSVSEELNGSIFRVNYIVCPEGRGSRFLQNVDIHLPKYPSTLKIEIPLKR